MSSYDYLTEHVFSWLLKYKKKKEGVGIKKHSKRTRDNIKYPKIEIIIKL